MATKNFAVTTDNKNLQMHPKGHNSSAKILQIPTGQLMFTWLQARQSFNLQDAQERLRY